jgi:hypothetical protein
MIKLSAKLPDGWGVNFQAEKGEPRYWMGTHKDWWQHKNIVGIADQIQQVRDPTARNCQQKVGAPWSVASCKMVFVSSIDDGILSWCSLPTDRCETCRHSFKFAAKIPVC